VELPAHLLNPRRRLFHAPDPGELAPLVVA
jgi:hypothetical protein